MANNTSISKKFKYTLLNTFCNVKNNCFYKRFFKKDFGYIFE